ncbi:MAG: cytochrome P450 [Rhizobiales bacterium]|nr:cytochrome P450 [Hyphomicrobiales bacterium]
MTLGRGMIKTYRGDPYSRASLRDSYPQYRMIRDMGSAVWLPKRRLWAVGRFADVRTVLRADQTFVSGKGVAANDFINRNGSPITLTSDGETHLRRRQVLIQPVMPAPLKELRPRLEKEANELVAGLSTGETFDAMSTLAAHLPVTVISELVGLNERGRARMLKWAAATFNLLGVLNLRGIAAMPRILQLLGYIRTLNRSQVKPGGWADRLFDAADRGVLSQAEATAMVIDYVGPALDTTILATGHMLWQLASDPDAYVQLRAEPDLIPGVVNEAVRLASPIRGFTRFAVEPFELGDSVIPAHSRVLVLFASANRDERHYDDPDRFDIRRNPRDHVGWGHGPHSCVGMHLARLEMEIILTSVVQQVARLEVDQPKLAFNNVLQGFKYLPMRLQAAA